MTMNASPSDPLSGHVRRIYSEYLEMPGLRLTAAQLQRLCGLDPASCILALQTLMDAGFLRCTTAGEYVRLTDGAVAAVPLRMAKSTLDPRMTRRVG